MTCHQACGCAVSSGNYLVAPGFEGWGSHDVDIHVTVEVTDPIRTSPAVALNACTKYTPQTPCDPGIVTCPEKIGLDCPCVTATTCVPTVIVLVAKLVAVVVAYCWLCTVWVAAIKVASSRTVAITYFALTIPTTKDKHASLFIIISGNHRFLAVTMAS